MTEYPGHYRKAPVQPEVYAFEAVAEGGEVIEVRRCLSAVALEPGHVYRGKLPGSGNDFFLFWAEDIGIAAQRALALARQI